MGKNDFDIDNSQKKYRTPISSEDSSKYNHTWAQTGNIIVSNSDLPEDWWDRIFGDKNE